MSDPVSALPASVTLAKHGSDVRLVRTAEEALALMPGFRACVVVTDLVLPYMSGLLLARQLKSDPLTRDTAVIAVSAIDAASLATEAGCAAYFRKPIDQQAYARTVAALVGDGS